MDAIFSGLGLFRELIFICPTYPKFMGVPPGLPVHVLEEHSHHLDFPTAFSIFFTNQDSGKIEIMRAFFTKWKWSFNIDTTWKWHT